METAAQSPGPPLTEGTASIEGTPGISPDPTTARSRAPPSISWSWPTSVVPATRGERASTTTPTTSTTSDPTDSEIHRGPVRSRSANRVIPSRMLTNGLTVTSVVRDAVIGPAWRAFCNRNNVPIPV